MPSPEERLSSFIATVSFEELSKPVVETVRRAFIDTVAVTLAGAIDNAGRKAYRKSGIAPEEADLERLLGRATTESPSEAALRFGTASHSLDYDDLSWAMDGHPSVTLVPPILALSDEANATGKEMMTAYAAGFEVESALANPVSPEHYEAGWHATATFGTFGAAAASARLLDLTRAQTRQALNIAASTPAGTKRNFGTMTKPLHAGLASRSGVTAAVLAADGFTADETAISGDCGFWDLYGPESRSEFALPDGWSLADDGVHVKAYPCCYFTHTSIAAAQALIEDHNLSPSDIRRIEVYAARGARDALRYGDPETCLEAKFSMEYTVASAVVFDEVGLATFEEAAIRDSAVRDLRNRVDFVVDESLPYDSHEAVVRIVTNDASFERRREHPPWVHSHPPTESALRTKFEECAGRVLPSEKVDSVYDTLAQLEVVADVEEALLREAY